MTSYMTYGENGVLLFEDFCNEMFDKEQTADIEISKIIPDERSNKPDANNFHVNYQINVDGNMIEIEGTLKPYNTGRSEEFNFEPGYLTDPESQKYYDEHWEEIESQIQNRFNQQIFK